MFFYIVDNIKVIGVSIVDFISTKKQIFTFIVHYNLRIFEIITAQKYE